MDKAMQEAARRISREANIPGFRKGKAPYQVGLQRFGVRTVMSEAIEVLGNEVYKEALEESKIEPYAPASLEDMQTDSGVKLVFVVPKQPEVELGAYRDLRLPFAMDDVEDSAVTDAIKELQERRALVEPAARPAQFGDAVKLHITATITHPESEGHHDHDEHDEHEHAEGEEHEHHEGGHTDPYMDDDVDVTLTDNEDKDELMPGFSANIVDMSVGDEKTFTLAFSAEQKETS